MNFVSASPPASYCPPVAAAPGRAELTAQQPTKRRCHLILAESTVYVGEPIGTLNATEETLLERFLNPANAYTAIGLQETDQHRDRSYVSVLVRDSANQLLLGTLELDDHHNVVTLLISQPQQPLTGAAMIWHPDPNTPGQPLAAEPGQMLHLRALDAKDRREQEALVRQQRPSSSEPSSSASSHSWERTTLGSLRANEWMKAQPADSTASAGGNSASSSIYGPASILNTTQQVPTSNLLELTNEAICAHAYRTDTRDHQVLKCADDNIRARLNDAGFDVQNPAYFLQVLAALRLPENRKRETATPQVISLHSWRLDPAGRRVPNGIHKIGTSLRAAGYSIRENKIPSLGPQRVPGRRPDLADVRAHAYDNSKGGSKRLPGYKTRERLKCAGFSTTWSYLASLFRRLDEEERQARANGPVNQQPRS